MARAHYNRPVMPIVDALLAAGSVPRPGDPLYAHTRGDPKALLPIHGRPMIQYVLDALEGATRIRNVVVVGLSAEHQAGLTCAKPLAFLPGRGALIDNLGAAAEWAAGLPEPPTHLLATSCDIPLLTAAMVDANVGAALETKHDGYFNLIPRAAMERRFPGVRRSFFRIAEGEFCSADLNLIALRVMRDYNPAWRQIFEARKNVLAMAGIVGFDFLLRGLIGRLSIPWGQQRIRDRLGIDGRIVITDQAETGMDVDRPEHLGVMALEMQTGDGERRSA